MFDWLFGTKKGASSTIAILDIGSGSVGGALGTLNNTGQPELLFVTREELPLRMTRKSDEMVKAATAATKVVMDRVRKTAALWSEGDRIAPKKINHLAVFLAAPWSTGTVRVSRIHKPEPFAMSAEVLRGMLTSEMKTATAHEVEGLEVLERVALGLKLNGYPVDTVAEVSVHEAEVTLATSLAPRALLTLLIEAIGDIPHGTRRTFHSFGLPVAHVLPRITPTIADGFLFDAGAEVTEIIRMKDSIPVGRATAPAGTHMLLRTLHAHSNMHKKEAETALKLAQLDGTRLSLSHTRAIEGAAHTWAKDTLLAAAALTDGGSPPFASYLFADAPAGHWLAHALAREPYPMQTSPIQKVHLLTGKDFEKTVRLRGATPDPFLCAELIFADERFDNNQSLELTSTREPLLSRPLQNAGNEGAILETPAPSVPAASVRTI